VAGGLVDIARERAPRALSIDWRAGDMLADDIGRFDHIVAMDSLIHYRPVDMARAVGQLASRARHSMIFTFAPQTPALAAMHALGKLFPKGDRSPAIEPVAEALLRDLLGSQSLGRTERIASGFYTSQAMEVIAR
jgi:magnesium-protoporphyrin O-methyltransferase